MLGRFSDIFYKGDNFYDYLSAFLHTSAFLKWVYLKRKEFAPKSSKFFPLSVDPFAEGAQNNLTKLPICSL